MSSCSEKLFVPTPFNTPQAVIRRESRVSGATATVNGEVAKLRTATPRMFGGQVSESDEAHLRGGGMDDSVHLRRGESAKVYLRGGGPKKRRGGTISGGRKKAKIDKYADVDVLMSDFKSPIFQEDVNIKVQPPNYPLHLRLSIILTPPTQAILTHPLTKQTMLSEGQPYPFDQMTGDELATTAAEFKLDGSYGRLDTDWMAQAMEASKTRAEGGFDEFLDEQFEEQWAEESQEVSEEKEVGEEKVKNEEGKGDGKRKK